RYLFICNVRLSPALRDRLLRRHRPGPTVRRTGASTADLDSSSELYLLRRGGWPSRCAWVARPAAAGAGAELVRNPFRRSPWRIPMRRFRAQLPGKRTPRHSWSAPTAAANRVRRVCADAPRRRERVFRNRWEPARTVRQRRLDASYDYYCYRIMHGDLACP